MRPYLALVLGTFALSACAGGGSGGAGGTNPPGGNTPPTQSQAASTAIAVTNSIGTPLKTFASHDAAISTAMTAAAVVRGGPSRALSSGSCNAGIEFFAPDRNGDPNSTETRWFYDSACAQVARDQVRLYSATGSGGETVNVTTQLYAAGNATPIAVRTDANVITGATFDANGFPIAANGFYRSSTQVLNIAGAKTIDSDDEIVMLPASGGSESFCSDSAGFNATGFPALGKTFGWQGMAVNGTRTPNADGSVTWNATHEGTDLTGAIGSLFDSDRQRQRKLSDFHAALHDRWRIEHRNL